MTVRNWLPRLALAAVAVMAGTLAPALEASAAERSVRPHRTPATAPSARRAERQPKRTSPERSATAAERESTVRKCKPPSDAKAAESSSEPWVAIYPAEK